jgi:hypothetical protein
MKRAIALALALCISGGATAQTFEELYSSISSWFSPDPYAGLSAFKSLLIPMGGTAEGMATAGTALAFDASFLDSNPAASAFLERTELTAYHNNWIADTKVEGLAYSRRWGGFGIGFLGKWLYLPFTEYDRYGEKVARGYYSETTVAFNVSYALLSSFYFPGIAVGMNVKTAWRLSPDYTDDEGVIIPGSGLAQSALAVMIDVGAMTQFDFLKPYHSRDRNVSIGVAVRNLGFPVQDEPLPSVASFGVAYSPFRPLTVTFDWFIPFLLSNLDLALQHYWGIGVAVEVTPFLDVRGGFLLKGGNPRISLGSSIEIGSWVLGLNYTLDLTTQFVPFNRLSVELQVPLGDEGRAEIAARVQELYLQGLELYAKGDLAGAIALWEQALSLDPQFDPAREGIATAKATLELQKQIDDIQKIEQ